MIVIKMAGLHFYARFSVIEIYRLSYKDFGLRSQIKIIRRRTIVR